jgi:HEAT repeat protein
LVVALGDSDAAVEQAAESALRRLGSGAADALAAGLGRETGDRVLGILLELGDAGVEPLRAAAQADEESARHRAIAGLLDLAKKTEDETTLEACFRTILASLGDGAPACRAEAAAGLAAFGDPRAAKALAAQLKDGDETVRMACRNTLGTIGSPAVPCLADALADRNPNSRLLAAGLLAEIDTTSVEVQDRHSVLTTLFDLKDSEDEDLARAVTTAITRVPAVDVIDRQLERLEDPNLYEREETEEFVRQLLEHGAIDESERPAMERRLTQVLADYTNTWGDGVDG